MAVELSSEETTEIVEVLQRVRGMNYEAAYKLDRIRAERQSAEQRAEQAEAETAELRKRLKAIEQAPDFSEYACDAILLDADNYSLKHELELERRRREQAEARIRELERRAGLGGPLAMRKQVRARFVTLKERTKSAEQRAENLAQQLAEKQAAQRLEAPPGALTFPYSTKELEAMRAVVAQYWEGHTADKRQPTQKTIGHALGELLGLPPQSNGDPARKAIALASAIKPDTLSDA